MLLIALKFCELVHRLKSKVEGSKLTEEPVSIKKGMWFTGSVTTNRLLLLADSTMPTHDVQLRRFLLFPHVASYKGVDIF